MHHEAALPTCRCKIEDVTDSDSALAWDIEKHEHDTLTWKHHRRSPVVRFSSDSEVFICFTPAGTTTGDMHAAPEPDQWANSIPVSAVSSSSACVESITLIVCIPIARAGFRLIPRSSRNTASLGATSSAWHAIS